MGDGIHAYIKDICRRLARLGYVAIAPDFFYRSGVNLPALTDIMPVLRGICSLKDDKVDGAWRRLIFDFRSAHFFFKLIMNAFSSGCR